MTDRAYINLFKSEHAYLGMADLITVKLCPKLFFVYAHLLVGYRVLVTSDLLIPMHRYTQVRIYLVCVSFVHLSGVSTGLKLRYAMTAQHTTWNNTT